MKRKHTPSINASRIIKNSIMIKICKSRHQAVITHCSYTKLVLSLHLIRVGRQAAKSFVSLLPDYSVSHLLTLTALPRQWVALETAILQSLRSRMLTSVSPFFLISLLVSMYLNFGLPLGLTTSTTMSSTVPVVWHSSLRLTCPCQRSRFCIRCVAIG